MDHLGPVAIKLLAHATTAPKQDKGATSLEVLNLLGGKDMTMGAGDWATSIINDSIIICRDISRIGYPHLTAASLYSRSATSPHRYLHQRAL